MTLLQQSVASVIGSDLHQHFQRARIKLTLFIFIFLSLLLLLSGLNTYETTRKGFESFRNQNNTFVPVRPDSFQQEQTRENNLRNVQQIILINNIIILIILTFLSWIGLYFLLLPLSKAVTEKEKFLTESSHELRTPLAILYSELSLAQNEENLQNLQKITGESLVEIKRLQNLSNTLLFKLNENQEVPKIEQIDINELLQEIWQKLQPINSKQIKLTKFPDPTDSTFIINKNREQIYRLFFNLLDNVIKHSTKDSTLQIEIDTQEKTILLQNQTEQNNYKNGNGLDICQDLAKKLDINLKIEMNNDRFVVKLTRFADD